MSTIRHRRRSIGKPIASAASETVLIAGLSGYTAVAAVPVSAVVAVAGLVPGAGEYTEAAELRESVAMAAAD
jgi:hypothetical protein